MRSAGYFTFLRETWDYTTSFGHYANDKLEVRSGDITFDNMMSLQTWCSAVVVIKTKYQMKINAEQKMGEVVADLIPRFEKLYSAQ